METKAADPKVMLGPEAAARHCGFSRRQLDRLRTRGEGPSYFELSEQKRLYDVDDLNAWLRSVRRTPSPR